MKKLCIALLLLAFCPVVLTPFMAPLIAPAQAQPPVLAQLPASSYYEESRSRYDMPYMLEYLPPLMGARVMIVPSVSLKKTGAQVEGSASYRVGWCGNDAPTRKTVSGQWNGAKIALELKDYDGKTDVSLKGDVEPKSGVVRGTASFADGVTRRFALIPGESSSLSGYNYPKPDRSDDISYPELAEAKKLQEYAHHISTMHFPKALAAMNQAMAIYNRLPASDIRRLEAAMTLVHFYANPNIETSDGGKSNICGKVREAQHALAAVQQMIDHPDPSWEQGARGQRFVMVMQDAVQFYSMQNKEAAVDKLYTKMIAVLNKQDDAKYTLPQALERWCDSSNDKLRKEKLKLQALACYDKLYDLPTRIGARNAMVMWYLQYDMRDKANLQVQEIARMLGMPDNNLRLSSNY